MKMWIPTVLIFLASLILYLFQVWNYDQILRAIEPWIPLFGPLLAAALVFYGWDRSHSDSLTRDTENWRRTQLTQLAFSFTTSTNQLRKTIGGTRFITNGDARFTELETTKEYATNITAIALSAQFVASKDYCTLLYAISQFALKLQQVAAVEGAAAPVKTGHPIRVSMDNAELIFQSALSLIPVATRAELGLHSLYPNGVAQITDSMKTIVKKYNSEGKEPTPTANLKQYIKQEFRKLPGYVDKTSEIEDY